MRATGKIHGLAVGREAAGSLVIDAVHFGFQRLGLRPLALVVLLAEEDVGALHASDAAQLVSGGLRARGGDEKLFALVAQQGGRVVIAPSVEDGFLLYGISGGVLLPLRCQFAALYAVDGKEVAGFLLQKSLIAGHGLLVVAGLVLCLGQIEQRQAVGVFVSDCVLIGSHCLGGKVHVAVAFGHLPGAHATLFLVLDGSAGKGFLVFGGGIEVFADGIEGIALLYVGLGVAGRNQRHATQDRYPKKAARGGIVMEGRVLHFCIFAFAIFIMSQLGTHRSLLMT